MIGLYRVLFCFAVGVVAAGQTGARAEPSTSPGPVVRSGFESGEAIVKGLPATPMELTFQGESVAKEWPVYLGSAESRAASSFKLTYYNAVSISPEQSRISVSVNGTTIINAPIGASRKAETLLVKLPLGVVQPGYNSVRVVVEQRHRVDCSVKATYELWSVLDGRQTGFSGRLAGQRTIKSLEELADVPPDLDGFTHIRLRVGGASEALLNTALSVAQAAVIAGKFDKPLIEVNPDPGAGPGLDILVSDHGSSADAAQLAANGVDDLPNVLLSGGTAERYQLSVLAPSAETLESSLRDLHSFVRTIQRQGTPSGLLALTNTRGRPISDGERISLAELGMKDQAFDGRFLRLNFLVALPTDLFSAPYGNVSFILDGGYGPDVSQLGRLNIRVNDRIAISQSLPSASGDTFNRQVLNLSVRYFQPGVNQISIEAQTPSTSDLSCAYGVTRDRVRFSLLSTSEVVLPQLAHVAKLPELSATLAGGYPFGRNATPLPMYVSRSEPRYLDAAATIVTTITARSGVAEPVQIRFDVPGEERRPGFVVAALAELPGSIGSRVRSLVAEPDDPAATPAAAVVADDTAKRPNGESDPDLPFGWREIADTNQLALDQLFGRAKSFGMQWLSNRGFDFSAASTGGRQSMPTDGLLVAQILRQKDDRDLWIGDSAAMDAKLDLWTVFAANSSDALYDDVKKLLSIGLWQNLSGELAVFDDANGRVGSSKPAEVVYVGTKPLSLQNMRLVIGGMLSNNMAAYAALILIGCLLLGCVTKLTLKQVGRADDRNR